MSIYPTKSYPITKGLSEFEILKASHKFLREDTDESQNKDNENGEEDEAGVNTSSRKKEEKKKTAWEDRLAENYYHSLYREFAVCDLKHYKSGHFALRWRTETEVLSGAGESTCGNTRCHHHHDHHDSSVKTFKPRKKQRKQKQERPLTTLELPFSYIEHGETKHALVKVVLCTRCVKKLMWKRRQDREHGVVDLGSSVIMDGDGSEDDRSEEEEEDDDDNDNEEREDNRVVGKRTGTGKEKEKERAGMRDEESSGRVHATAEIKTRSREKNRGDEHDNHVEENGPFMREPRSRRRQRNSRSRSPPRRHSDSHSQSYSSSSRNYRHAFDRRNVE